MAVLLYHLSSRCRERLRVVCSGLLGISAILSLATIIYSLLTYIYLDSGSVIDMLWKGLPVLNYSPVIAMGVAAFCLVLNWIMLGCVRRLWSENNRFGVDNVDWRTLIVLSIAVPLAFAVCLTAAFAHKLPSELAMAIHLRMRRLANDSAANVTDQYLHDLQIEMSCCGVHGPRDYLALHDVNLLENNNPLEEVMITFPPLSCCMSFECSKYDMYLLSAAKQNYSRFNDWYHPTGCVLASQWLFFLPHALLTPILLGAALLLQIIIAIICQICFSAYATLHDSGLSNKADSFGYLLAFGYPAFEDIMLMMQELANEDENDEADEDGQPVKISAQTKKKQF